MSEQPPNPSPFKVRVVAPEPATISVAMIVRDEEAKLAGILADAGGFADEIVVVDTGSIDSTMAIARNAGAKVFEFPWIDDFAAARNESFRFCTCDWIMWLDADDRLPASVQAALNEHKRTTLISDIDAVFAEYRLFDPTGTKQLMRFERERLVRRGAGLRWEGRVHEALTVPASRWTRVPDVWVEHRPAEEEAGSPGSGRNLRILQRLYDEGDRTPRTLYYLGNEYRENGHHDRAVEMYNAYLDVTVTDWEEYDARIALGNALLALERPEEAYEQAMQAITDDPGRAEAFMAAAMHFYRREEWAKAASFFLAATATRRPDHGFSYDANYSYLPWDFLGVCYYRLGRQHEAIEVTLKALALGSPDRDRLKANLAFMAEEI